MIFLPRAISTFKHSKLKTADQFSVLLLILFKSNYNSSKFLILGLDLIESLRLSIVCVFDLAQIKCKCCVLIMGIFHLLMVYMAVLNEHFSDSGLKDDLSQNGIVAEVSTRHYEENITTEAFVFTKSYRKHVMRIL